MSAKVAKVHNAAAAVSAKIEIRQNVLAALRGRAVPAHVFDAFCGPVGEMWRGVWRDGATSYVGCDEAYTWPDPRRRFVGDNRRVMRSIPLSPYNVFDLDAFGSPWEQMVILMARRIWTPGEIGAVVLTDGSAKSLQFGAPTQAIAHLLHFSRAGKGLPPVDSTSSTVQRLAILAWLRRSGLRPLGGWKAESRGSMTKANQGMKLRYSAYVFEAVGRDAVATPEAARHAEAIVGGVAS